MLQPFLFDLSRSIVKDRDLLKPRMKITPYNQHWRWLLSRALVLFVAYQSTRDEPTSLCNQPKPSQAKRRDAQWRNLLPADATTTHVETSLGRGDARTTLRNPNPHPALPSPPHP